MALKRMIDENTQYYARIDIFNKEQNNLSIGVTMFIEDLTAEITEKIREDSTYEDIRNFGKVSQTTMYFLVSKPCQDKTSTPELFLVENLSKLENNYIKASYDWLKINVDLFKDFEDC